MMASESVSEIIAVVLFRPWQSKLEPPDLVTQPAPVARVAVASGPVEVLPVDKIQSFTCPTGGAL